MKRAWIAVVALLLLVAAAGPQGQGRTVWLLGSVVPANSLWDRVLKDFAGSTSQLTQGRVQLRIVPGQGDEETILRKMQIAGQLQAASLTAIGLAEVDPAFNVFGTPLFFDSYDELHYVQDRLTPTLKGHLEAKGLVLLNWGNAGWVQVFSKKPVRTMDDLKALTLFTSAGDDRMVQWYKDNGFRPVPLAVTDITASLQRGMIEALPSTPLAALFFNWYSSTQYMLDVGLAPLVGATVVTKKAWESVSQEDRTKLLDAAARAERTLRLDVPKQDQGAIAEMQKRRNLTITKADVSPGSEWRVQSEKFATSMRGSIVPADIFDMAVKERAAFRQQRGGKGEWPQ
jgi:TRAP-type C4-dicarboxylate transport system substrate-binding protein